MNYLPVPPLEQTLQRYLATVRPLLDESEYRATERVTAEFGASDGPACQQALLDFAAQEDADGRSWLSDAWLDGYLAVRKPLPLASNVGFQLNWTLSSRDWAGVGDLIYRFAAVHLAYLRGEVTDDPSPRGGWRCLRQWSYLAGGVRRPHAEHDEFVPGPEGAAGREIVVLWRGRASALTVSDDAGQPLAPPLLRDALDTLTGAPDTLFTVPSYLGGAKASEHLDALLADPANAETYRRITDAIFCVAIADDPDDDATHLERLTFKLGKTWAHKPVTYLVCPADGFVGMHVEHSVVDGSTLKAVVARAQQVVPPVTHEPGASTTMAGLKWQVSDDRSDAIAADAAAYRRRVPNYRVRIVRTPFDPPSDPPFKLSLDACQQFVLLYGQLVATGGLRSTYEAVDMREYQAGRTECLRPNTAEAVELAGALKRRRATPELLHAALDAHRERVRACKEGQAIDRHLFGLKFAAGRLGRDVEFFRDEGYRRLVDDFLSTTSLGDTDQFLRYAFAPAVMDGIGVSYHAVPDGFEFVLTYRESKCPHLEPFAAALPTGAVLLAAVVRKAAAG